MAIDIGKREFIAAVGAAALAWPLTVRAQQPATPVIGYLGGTTAREWAPYVNAFRQGLSETDFVEGRNVAIEYRWAEGQYDRLPAMAADLVDRQVTVITTAGTPAALAAKAATVRTPIVFSTIGDPVQIGLVASLSHPGGNVTGATQLNVEIGPKLLELMHEVVPTATSIALLVNPTNPTAQTLSGELQAAAGALGLELHVLNASTEAEIDLAFATLVRLRAGGLVLGGDAFINAHSKQIAVLARHHAVPSIYQGRVYAEAGGLMSYGGSAADAYRQAGVYTGRILKGGKPSDLPVVQATKVEMILNLSTAKALGITLPLSLLGRADEVIE
jgi:putative ABC transport system substrate-binding protein